MEETESVTDPRLVAFRRLPSPKKSNARDPHGDDARQCREATL